MQPLPAKKMEYTYDIDTEGYVRRRKIAAAKRSYTYETDAEGWIKRKSIVLLGLCFGCLSAFFLSGLRKIQMAMS